MDLSPPLDAARHGLPDLPHCCARYVVKLAQELEAATQATFTAPSDRDRAKSVLADLHKTAGDFRGMTVRALEVVAAGIVPRLRCCSPFDNT